MPHCQDLRPKEIIFPTNGNVVENLRTARLQSPRKQLKIVEVDDPQPGPGEVVVRVDSSGVCHSDLHIARGEFASVEYPITLGHEPAGTIYSVGEAVKDLKVG